MDYSDEKQVKALNDIFRYHAPKNDQLPRYEEIRSVARLLAQVIEKHCPPSREKSLAVTHLQSAVMFANSSIAIHESLPNPLGPEDRPAPPPENRLAQS